MLATVGHVPARRVLGALAAVVAIALLVGPTVGSAVAAPVDVTTPEVQGIPKIGERLVCASGSWSMGPLGEGVKEFRFSWVRSGKFIEGATMKPTPDYTLVPADEHQEIWCVVYATNKESPSEAFAESENSKIPGGPPSEPPEAPKEVSEPEVSPGGTTEVGKQLTCQPGTWSGRPTPKLTYQWLREGVGIPSATSQTYMVVSEDEGHHLSCKVTATNSQGEPFGVSKNSVEVKGHGPESLEAPKIQGLAEVGETLTCTDGTWKGTLPMTFTFQWLLGGKPISGATGDTLPVEVAYEGQEVSCRVTAKNSVGEVSAASAEKAVGIPPPESISPPEITGPAEVGKQLTCSEGQWTGSPTKYEYRWFKENEQLAQTTNKFTVVSADVGHKLFCVVTAENGGGKSEPRQSAAFVIPEVGGEKPAVTGKPAVSGIGKAGSELKCSEGTWSHSPTSFEYQWIREDINDKAEVTNRVSIPGAEAKGYVVQAADEGHSLLCRVTAVNKFGQATAESEPLYIHGRKPSPTKPPSISGTPRLEETLTCQPGEWEASPAPVFTYTWLRDGTKVVGSTFVYKVGTADRGHDLSCRVTASNDEGSGEASSSEVSVPGLKPEATVAPKITGTPKLGETLSCEEGTWIGAPEPEVSYEWLLNGSPIASETQKQFTVGTIDRGQRLSCRVTEKNREGQASASSEPVNVAGTAPRDSEAPSVSGVAALGGTLTCALGKWAGTPPPSLGVQWYRDEAAVPGATSSTYAVESADQGHLLSCVVIASNSQGRVEVESVNGIAIPGPKSEQPLAPPGPREKVTLRPGVVQVRDALISQLARALSGAHVIKVLKSGGFSISFTAPGAGTLAMQWYGLIQGASGAKRPMLASGSISYSKESKATLRLRLTREGRHLFGHKRRLKLTAKALFTVTGGVSVPWSGTITLKP